MKGVIHSIAPAAVITDITHEIAPQDVSEVAFILTACCRDFPPGTVFLCVVDPGVGSERRAIIVETHQHHFVGPDNGLFSFIFHTASKVFEIANDRYFRKPVSSTFHGRDIFAPAAAHLSLGVAASEFGPRVTDPVVFPNTHPVTDKDGVISGSVIHIDRFGNIVTNITTETTSENFELQIGDSTISEVRQTYAAGSSRKPFAIAGSAGFIEISVNGGSAAELLGACRGMPVTIRQR
jgi:S-adenosylmethionine hydrolase